jgi:hypothetical protein
MGAKEFFPDIERLVFEAYDLPSSIRKTRKAWSLNLMSLWRDA